uniref:CSON002041 protein n=1 Tax=Culicoides sonorensis TaxID=179676 RepID=A0A336L907_CULSO
MRIGHNPKVFWSQSNDKHFTIRNLHFDAAGTYYCEVTTDTPIYTKASQDAVLHVILPQTGPPRITFKKRQFFIGEKLIANCTTSKAQPAPHITWLINGKKVAFRSTCQSMVGKDAV